MTNLRGWAAERLQRQRAKLNIEKTDFARGRGDSCTPIALSNRGRKAFRRGILEAVKL